MGVVFPSRDAGIGSVPIEVPGCYFFICLGICFLRFTAKEKSLDTNCYEEQNNSDIG